MNAETKGMNKSAGQSTVINTDGLYERRKTIYARSVSGVQRVVRVLEIVTEAELKPPPPTPATPASSAPKS